MSIQLESIDSRGSFRLLRDGIEALQLKYQNRFSLKATTFFNDQEIAVLPKNFWMTKFDIFKDSVDVGDIICNFTGYVIIQLLRADGKGQDEFMLKHRGLMSKQYGLLNKKNECLLTLKTNFNWKTFKYNHEVIHEDHDFPDIVLNELLIYCGFAANLRMMSNGMG